MQEQENNRWDSAPSWVKEVINEQIRWAAEDYNSMPEELKPLMSMESYILKRLELAGIVQWTASKTS